jgi:hypothetical protein
VMVCCMCQGPSQSLRLAATAKLATHMDDRPHFGLQRLAAAEEQYDTGLRKLTATAKQIAALQRQV